MWVVHAFGWRSECLYRRAAQERLGYLQDYWRAFVEQPSAHLTDPLHSLLIFGLSEGITLALMISFPILIASGAVEAGGLFRRRNWSWFWWLTLGCGILFWLSLALQGRKLVLIAASLSPADAPLPPWQEGWLYEFEGEKFLEYARAAYPHTFGVLLAALVLTLSAWRRRREGEAPAEP
jgi:hypothetical protein